MATPPKSAGTDELGAEIDEMQMQLDDHEKRLAALEGGSGPTPPDPPQPDGDFTWAGLDTVFPTAGPRVARTPYSGSTTFNEPSKISGKKFTSTLNIKCDGMEFEDCEIEVGNAWGIDADSKKFKITYSSIKGGGGPAALLGIADVWYCDVSGFQDGIKIQGDNVAVRGCYVHDLMPAPGQADPHHDGIQLSGTNNGVVIEQNVIAGKDTSDIFIKPEVWQGNPCPITNVTVKNNKLVGSPGYKVYMDNTNNGGMTGLKLTDNILSKGGYGYFAVTDCTPEITGNIDEKGRPITGAKEPW